VEDCYSENYKGAPRDGLAWLVGDCYRRVVRGGSWLDEVPKLRSAYRGGESITSQDYRLGFRVARVLIP
jgi:formylglycine-generating enzyme required for sulfatase activity